MAQAVRGVLDFSWEFDVASSAQICSNTHSNKLYYQLIHQLVLEPYHPRQPLGWKVLLGV